MRTLLGGLVCVWLMALCATIASAQVTGRVETIGLDGIYRPGCWTPMLVKLQSQGSPTGLYELRVRQFDADGDQPYFSTRVTLTAGRGEQGFWTYFLPEPIRGGLTGISSSSQDLQQRLRITVHDTTGRELAQVTVGKSVPQSVDPIYGGFDRGRGRRLIALITDGGASTPPLGHYDLSGTGGGNNGPPAIVGLQEDLTSVRLRHDQLPESALGFDGVDAIVWLDGDPAQLSAGGSRRLDAIRDYVARGGHLVISTPAQWQQLAAFGDLMPVDIEGVEPNALQSPVRDIATAMPIRRRSNGAVGAPLVNPWDAFTAPFTIATARARPGAVVDRTADRVAEPVGPADETPWLVRRPLGYGCVTWVGQDLGARDLGARANWGWPRVWELVLGTGSAPQVFPDTNDVARYRATNYRDLGATVLDAMNLSGRAAALVGVTLLFFIGYWALAGPGTYFFLRYRGRATASWFVFGAVALGATAVTLAVVRVMLRGSPQVRHVSLVRVDADRAMPAKAVSRLGVYVPRDGSQEIALLDTDPRYASTVTPFPIHPSLHSRRDGDRYLFPSPIVYGVSVPTGEESPAPRVDVPFRTTMKRLRADWMGASPARIDGTASLRPTAGGRGFIAGSLVNESGNDLRNIYVAFRHQTPGVRPTLWMMYVARWPRGETLDLGKAFNPQGDQTIAQIQLGSPDVRPNDRTPVRGQFSDWATYFGGRLRAGGLGDAVLQNDLGEANPASVPVLSFFEQLPPIENVTNGGSDFDQSRADLHRSGLRDWDVGNALIAGRLVIVAQADATPLPVPMTIDGDSVTGSGTTIYQFVLPLAPIPPTTQPTTTQPTTTRANDRLTAESRSRGEANEPSKS